MGSSEDNVHRAKRSYEPKLSSVPEARHFAIDKVINWGLDPTFTEMVVGELVANAVIHGRSRFTVELTDRDDHIRIGVRDANPRWPVKCEMGPDTLGGRGLHIVEAVSRDWGVSPSVDVGKVIWADLYCKGDE